MTGRAAADRRSRPRRSPWLARCLLVALGALLAAAGARAHAELLEISPADGEVLAEAPAEAVLRFSEQVSLTGGSASVLDDTGAPVVVRRPSVVDVNVVIPLDGGLGDGTYTVAWNVISVDSHRDQRGVGVPRRGALGQRPGRRRWRRRPAGGCALVASVLTALAYAGALVARRRLVVHDAASPTGRPRSGGRW